MAQYWEPDEMIGEFERRLREMSESMVQVSFAAMVLAATEATNERSFAWFDDRAQAALKELERRGTKPGPLPGQVIETARGVPPHNRSLTQDQARQVRACWEAGQPLAEIARDFGVQEITAWRIIKNETYRELPPPGPPDHLRTT